MQTESRLKTKVTPKVTNEKPLEEAPVIQSVIKKDKTPVLARVRCRRRF